MVLYLKRAESEGTMDLQVGRESGKEESLLIREVPHPKESFDGKSQCLS